MTLFFSLLVLITTVVLSKNLALALSAAIITIIGIDAYQMFHADEKVFSIQSILVDAIEPVYVTFKNVIFSPDYYYSIFFLVLIVWILEIFAVAGVTRAYEKLFSMIIATKKKFEKMILLTSIGLFLDDYFSAMCLKSFFSPLLSTYSLSKNMFSYYISSNACSIASMAPIGTWSAILSAQLTAIASVWEIEKSGYILFLSSIPFFIYPILSIMSSYLVFSKRNESNENIVLVKTKFSEKLNADEITKIFLFFIPLLTIIGCVVGTIIHLWFKYRSEFIISLTNVNFSYLMTVGVVLGIFIVIPILLIKGSLKFFDIFSKSIITIRDIWKPIFTLVLAWAFSKILLGYVNKSILLSFLHNNVWVQSYLPLICMIFSMISAMLIGTCWGTAALVTSILIVFPPMPEMLPAIFGAIISGALAGSHLTPTSDATISASLAATNNPFDTFTNQFALVMPGIIASIIFFFMHGLLFSCTYPLIKNNLTNSLFIVIFTSFILPVFKFILERVAERYKDK